MLNNEEMKKFTNCVRELKEDIEIKFMNCVRELKEDIEINFMKERKKQKDFDEEMEKDIDEELEKYFEKERFIETISTLPYWANDKVSLMKYIKHLSMLIIGKSHIIHHFINNYGTMKDEEFCEKINDFYQKKFDDYMKLENFMEEEEEEKEERKK